VSISKPVDHIPAAPLTMREWLERSRVQVGKCVSCGAPTRKLPSRDGDYHYERCGKPECSPFYGHV
jgi:hypothetical protein